MRVRTKLLIGFSVIAVILWMIAIFAANNFTNLKDQFTVIEEEVIPATLAMNELEKVATDAYHETMKYILHDDVYAEEAALTQLSRLQEIETRFYPFSITAAEEFQSNQVLMSKIADLIFSVGILMDYKRRGASNEELLARDRTTTLPALLALQEETSKRRNQYIEELAVVKSDFNYVHSNGIQSLFLAAIMGTLLAALAALFTTRSIVRPLLALHKGTEMIASGNLKWKVGTKASDEIGQLSRAFDHMTQSLSSSMTSIDTLNQEIAERKQAEEALKESQEFNASLLENSTHATVVINPDTSIRYVNPTWEKLNGWTLKEIKGIKAPYPWWPEELKEAFNEGFKEAIQQDGNGEVPAQKKNGEIYWISMNWTSVKKDGEIQYLLINSIDITERKRMEEALRESEEKFSKAFHSSPNSTSITTIEDGVFLEVNDSFTNISGYTREEVIGHSSKELNIWAKPEERDRIIKILKEEGQVINEEFIACTKSGEYSTMLFSAEPINVGGKECLISISVDITERKKTEQFQHDENYVLTLLGQGAELNEILEAIVRLGEARDPSIKGLILRYDASKELLIPASAPSLPTDYTDLLKDGLPIGPNIGTCGTAAYRKERVVVSDIENSPLFKPFAEAVKKSIEHDLRACWSQPIISSNGDVLGTIANYRNKVDEPSEDDLRVLEWSARIAAIAIERKQSEEALSNEAVRRRILIEQSRDGIVVVDENGKVYEANQRFAEMLGYSMEEVKHLSISDWEAFLPEERVAEMIATVDETGDHFETKHVRKDGTIFDVEISSNAAVFQGQKLIFCVCRDITERKRDEQALRNNEERFRLLSDNSTDLISRVQLSPTVKTDYVSPSCLHITGYSQEEFYSNDNLGMEMIHPDDRELFKNTTVKDNENPSKPITIRLVRKDGGIVWVEQTHTFIFDENGEPAIMHVIAHDITERKEAEEALRESEERYRDLFDNARELIQSIAPDGSFVYVNQAWKNVLGYTDKEINNMQVWDIIHPDALPHCQEVFQKLMSGETVDSVETTFVDKGGNSIQVEGDVTVQYQGDRVVATRGIFRDITARKEAEEAMRESEEKFSKAFRSSPNSISISTLKDGKFIEVNDSFLRDKGYTREEVIGRTSDELGLFVKATQRDEIIKKLKKNGRVHNEVVEFRAKNGEYHTSLLSAEFITISNEPCMIVINTDITERKQAEEQIRLLGSVTQQVLDSTIVTDLKFNITYMNKAAQQLLGYSFEEVTGKNLAIFDIEPLPKDVSREIMKTVSAGKVWNGTIMKRRKDGAVIVSDCRLSPLYNEDKKIIGYIDVERDVTKQKEIEAKLQIHKLLIENILSAMPGGVLVVDDDNHILLTNEAFHKIFHIGKRAIKAKPFDETIPINELVELYEAVKQGKEEKGCLEFRYSINGLEKIITCNIIKMDGGRTLLTFTDISREREEEEKLYLTDRLASIGEMAAGLAHELNNPLTGILALSQMLINSEIPPEYQEDLNCVYSEAKRAADIVKNVLLFARNNNYENGHASANEVIQNVLRLREYEEKVNNITVLTNFNENLPDVAIDKFQLQQVFLNMILNAEAAITETKKAGTLTVTTERSNGSANVIFSDNGCGIKKNILPRIFDPFFTTKDIGKGTGLGLSICYGIVVKNGGKISVKSQVNEGTTFTIKIPIAN